MDESMSKWRGQKLSHHHAGGHPHVTCIPRKPEPLGTELRALADAATHAIIQIEIQEGKAAMRMKEHSNLGGGCGSIMRMVWPWRGSGRIVVGDSAFASVTTAFWLYWTCGIYFIGLVKTATKYFPVAYLKRADLYPSIGDSTTIVARLNLFSLNSSQRVPVFGFGWRSKHLKTFVSTCGTSSVEPEGHWRWRRQIEGVQTKRVPSSLSAPHAVKLYYACASAVDTNNLYRQFLLNLEDSWGTHCWWHRLFATIWGMILINAFLAFTFFEPARAGSSYTLSDFLLKLLNQQWSRGNVSQNPSNLQQSTHPTSTEIPVLLPTDMRHSPGSKVRRKTFRCHVCSVRYAVFYCSLCLETLCGSSKRSTENSRQSVCFFSHIGQAHPEFEVVFRGLNSFNHVHPRLDHFQQDLSTRSWPIVKEDIVLNPLINQRRMTGIAESFSKMRAKAVHWRYCPVPEQQIEGWQNLISNECCVNPIHRAAIGEIPSKFDD